MGSVFYDRNLGKSGGIPAFRGRTVWSGQISVVESSHMTLLVRTNRFHSRASRRERARKSSGRAAEVASRYAPIWIIAITPLKTGRGVLRLPLGAALLERGMGPAVPFEIRPLAQERAAKGLPLILWELYFCLRSTPRRSMRAITPTIMNSIIVCNPSRFLLGVAGAAALVFTLTAAGQTPPAKPAAGSAAADEAR